jgi:hypothetical protein
MDLLGFRREVEALNWDFGRREVQAGFRRIAVFHHATLVCMNPRYEIVNLNDAVVVGTDIPQDPGARKHLEEFLSLIDFAFETAAIADRHIGGAGVRGVVCGGHRHHLPANLGWTSQDRPREQPSFFAPRPVMMNTAFGRAYAAETSGELVKCSALYVEHALLSEYSPAVMESWNLTNRRRINGVGDFLLVKQYAA